MTDVDKSQEIVENRDVKEYTRFQLSLKRKSTREIF